MNVRIRREPAEYDFDALEFDVKLLTKHFTATTSRKRYVVVHHMTIVGDGDGDALDACYQTWQNRPASAQYGVDGNRIRQFVWDAFYAWATGSTAGNRDGISIEHANSTGAAGGWKVSETTWRTGAKLAAYLHVVYKMGRPVADKTIRRHSSFVATACPGPFLGGSTTFAAYVKEAQRVYDLVTAGKPVTDTPTPPTTPPRPSTDRMDPAAYFIGASGKHVTWYGERLVMHLRALGITPAYKEGPGPKFTATDQLVTKQFQNAQGWTGDDADGFPGPETLRRLAADPVVNRVTVRAMFTPLAGYNGLTKKGVTRWKQNTDGTAALVLDHAPDLWATTELSNRVVNRMLPRMDAALEDDLIRVKGGSDGRYIYRDPDTTSWVAHQLVTTPNTEKLRLRGDDKQGFILAYGKRPAVGVYAVFHGENEQPFDNGRVEQAMWFAGLVEAFARAHHVPPENVLIVMDSNSESYVAEAFKGRKFDGKPYRVLGRANFRGWDRRSAKPFDLAVSPGEGSATEVSNAFSDHDSLDIVHRLITTA